MDKSMKVEFLFDFGSLIPIWPNTQFRVWVAQQRQVRICPRSSRRNFRGDRQYVTTRRIAGIKNKLEFVELQTDRFVRRYGVVKFKRNPFSRSTP